MRTTALTKDSELSPTALRYLLMELEVRKFSGAHLEIGTAAGGTLKAILELYKKMEHEISNFFVIDPMTYFPDQYDVVVDNLRPSVDISNVEFIQMKSGDAYRSKAGEVINNLDFILIDGSHKIKYVAQDIRWADKLNVGGLLCFDDYQAGFPGVDYVVNRLVMPTGMYEKVFFRGRLLVLRRANSGPKMISGYQALVCNLLHPILNLRNAVQKRFNGC